MMKGRMLFRALRNIDEQLILNAAPGEWAKVRRRAALARWSALAACLCILAVGIFFVYLQNAQYLPHPENTTPPGSTVTPPAQGDTIVQEPVPEDHPYLKMQHPERMRLAPHVAWASIEARQRLIGIMADNIARGW